MEVREINGAVIVDRSIRRDGPLRHRCRIDVTDSLGVVRVGERHLEYGGTRTGTRGNRANGLYGLIVDILIDHGYPVALEERLHGRFVDEIHIQRPRAGIIVETDGDGHGHVVFFLLRINLNFLFAATHQNGSHRNEGNHAKKTHCLFHRFLRFSKFVTLREIPPNCSSPHRHRHFGRRCLRFSPPRLLSWGLHRIRCVLFPYNVCVRCITIRRHTNITNPKDTSNTHVSPKNGRRISIC